MRAILRKSALIGLLVAGCGGPLALGPAGPGNQLATQQGAGGLNAMAVPAPNAAWMPSGNFNDRPAGMAIDTVLIHHTAARTNAASTAEFFANPASKVSSHYIVDRDGSIVRCVLDKDRAWHAGVSAFDGRPNVNNFSIGIEICNVGDNTEPYPVAQVQSTARLTAYLLETYQIPTSRITRHRDVALPPGRKDDTSDNFPLQYYFDCVAALLADKPLPSPPAIARPPANYDSRIRYYTVAPGDTWETIADGILDTPTRAEELRRFNPQVEGLFAGQRIRIPTDYSEFQRLNPSSASLLPLG